MTMRVCLVLAAAVSVVAQPPAAPVANGGAACDACGSSATYSESITTDGVLSKRTIATSGCPNHYSICTGKPGKDYCGNIGQEGPETEATDQSTTLEIPGSPVMAATTTDVECSMGSIAIALNGVSIFGGAVDQSCNLVDVDDSTSEWTAFDMCSGHAQAAGVYHYHFPPSCLLAQAVATNPTSDGHSPQIGWAYDGFPIYGPNGVGGTKMTRANLDECNGVESEIPALDKFKYRYYFIGEVTDLYALPGNPKPVASEYPFTIKCYKGCTWAKLKDGSCTGTSGVASDYTASANSGYTTQFAAYGTSGNNFAGNTYTSEFLSGGQCISGSSASSTSSTSGTSSTSSTGATSDAAPASSLGFAVVHILIGVFAMITMQPF